MLKLFVTTLAIFAANFAYSADVDNSRTVASRKVTQVEILTAAHLDALRDLDRRAQAEGVREYEGRGTPLLDSEDTQIRTRATALAADLDAAFLPLANASAAGASPLMGQNEIRLVLRIARIRFALDGHPGPQQEFYDVYKRYKAAFDREIARIENPAARRWLNRALQNLATRDDDR